MSTPIDSQSADVRREQRIGQVVARCQKRLSTGKELEVAQLLTSLPDLAPDLEIRLQIAIMLDQARKSALNQEGPDTKSSKPSRNRNSSGSRRPETIGPYRVVGELGRGGMGIVYEAIESQSKERVAVKTLHPAAVSDDECQRFMLESKLSQRLSHPHIVPVLTVGDVDGLPYLVMKIIHGVSLDRLCKKSLLPTQICAKAIRQIAEALAYAHEKGILHRDIKPSNIILDVSGSAFLTDFGLAKVFGSETLLTKTGQTLGTPNFMSPEQALGEKEKIGPTSDIYSLGATLYACITGELPFKGEHFAATLVQVITQAPIPPSQLNPNVDRRLEEIVLICMRREPQARFDSANDLAVALRSVEREPVEHLPDIDVSSIPQTVTPSNEGNKKRRAPVGWIVAVVVALLILSRLPGELSRINPRTVVSTPPRIQQPSEQIEQQKKSKVPSTPQPEVQPIKVPAIPQAPRHQPPQISAIPNITLKFGDSLARSITTDREGLDLQYRLVTGPAKAQVDKAGRINWTPGKTDAGSRHAFTVSVIDPAGEKSESSFFVTVSPLPLGPTISSIKDVTLIRGGAAKIDVRIDRREWTGSIEIGVTGLPAGVTANRVTVPTGKDSAVITLTSDSNSSATATTISLFCSADGEVSTKATKLTINKPPGLELIFEEKGDDPKLCKFEFSGTDKGGTFHCTGGVMSTQVKRGHTGGPNRGSLGLHPDALSLDEDYQCEIRIRVRPFPQNSFVNFGCSAHFTDPKSTVSGDILDWTFSPNSTMNCQRRIWTPISMADPKKGTQNTRTDDILASMPSGSLLSWQTLAIKLERNRVSWFVNGKSVASRQLALTGRNGERLKGHLSFFLIYNHFQSTGGTIDLDHVRVWRLNN